MVITRAHYHHLFQQEAQRLSHIDFTSSYCLEIDINSIVYRPVFLSKMEEQFMNTLAKEQIRTLVKFSGDPREDVIKWLSDVEMVFDRAQLQTSNKYLAVQSYLTEAAEKWFRHNKSTISDWPTFKLELIKAYQPSLNQTLLQMEQRRQSPHESVLEYYVDKRQLCLQADPSMSSAMVIHYLTKGLNSTLIPHVIRRRPVTPPDFLVIAQDEEKIQLTLNSLAYGATHAQNIELNNDDIDDTVTLVQRPASIHSRISNNHQHQRILTPTPLMQSTYAPRQSSSSYRSSYPQHPSSSFASYQCYQCYRFGHIAKNCPHRKNM